MKGKNFFACMMIGIFLISCIGYADAASNIRKRKAVFVKPLSEKGRKATIPATAEELALAMDVPQESIISASIGKSDTKGVGVSEGNIGHYLPTKGGSFVILSTGLAEYAETSNTIGSLSGNLNGDGSNEVLKNSQGNDMVQLVLELKVPDGATCFGFDFVYYSEEFPEWVGSSFNDTFTAEIDESNFTIESNKVTAPNNFAFDTEGNIISVNAVFGMKEESATTYDGGTSLLKAVRPIPAGASTIKIFLTVQDLGDSAWDSAVFIDNFYWSNDANCSAGAMEDSDGDGLLDEWETNGLDTNGDGKVDLDLKGMGADPQHKDIFVEVDYMAETVCSGGYGFGECISHSHQPKKAAIQKVIDSFNNSPVSNPDGTTGIRLHVDAGADFIMNSVTNETWGEFSKANSLFHEDYVGGNVNSKFNWEKFEKIKDANFSVERKNIFRYCVFAHNLAEKMETVSGASQGAPGSGFVVTLGEWTNGIGTVNEQAGTFMHMLGNNLGLGEKENTDFSPNYLSVMNSLFQTGGLIINGENGNFDYSRFEIPALDENKLDETVGFNVNTGADEYGTLFFVSGEVKQIANINNPIDWDNDGVEEKSVAADINKNGKKNILPASVNEWSQLIFKGGEVGSLGIIYDAPDETDSTGLSEEEDNEIPKVYGVSISGSSVVILKPGASGTYSLTIKNTGEKSDTYSLAASGNKGWTKVDSLVKSVTLDAGKSETFDIAINIPAETAFGEKESLTVSFTSQASPNLTDTLEAVILVLPPGDVDGDAQVDIHDIATLKNYILKLGSTSSFPDINNDGKVNIKDIAVLMNKVFEE